jgi:hypothetical protein
MYSCESYLDYLFDKGYVLEETLINFKKLLCCKIKKFHWITIDTYILMVLIKANVSHLPTDAALIQLRDSMLFVGFQCASIHSLFMYLRYIRELPSIFNYNISSQETRSNLGLS